MASLAKKTIHLTHSHPLVEVSVDTEFLCDGCKTPGSGKCYRCEYCYFYLHDYCGTCPMELSSFMHDHNLVLVDRMAQGARWIDRTCDLCGDFVRGLFYWCSLCDFNVHPICTQLPQDVRHVMHKDHPLRLQRSVPGQCRVCYNTCTSWHYKCGLCNFDLHLECVVAPCEEATTESTSRSSPSPGFGAGYGYGYGYGFDYGYGGTPPPGPPPNFSYAPYRAPLALPYYGPYANGYGIGTPPPGPPPNFSYAPYGAPLPLPYYGPYANGYGIGTPPPGPPPKFSNAPYRAPLALPYYGPYDNGYGIPSSSFQNNVHCQHNNGSQGEGGGGGKPRKKMYAIVGKLVLAVLGNVVLGTIGIGPIF